MKIIRNALVITPTIGSKNLVKCVESVRYQTYQDVHHLIVTDGAEHNATVNHMLLNETGVHENMETMFLPWNVGNDNGPWYGHRVYASVPKLIPQKKFDYILFLDEDNWYDDMHVENCIDLIEEQNLDWCHSLRGVFDDTGKYLLDDNCESLGKWPIFGQIGNHLVDTSSFCFTYKFIRHHCHLWDHGWGGDRKFLMGVYQNSNWEGTGQHTLSYRLGGNENSVKVEFFLKGNEITRQQNPQGYPWLKT